MRFEAVDTGRFGRGLAALAACAALLAPMAITGCGRVTSTDIPGGKVDETSLTLDFEQPGANATVKVGGTLQIRITLMDANNRGADGKQVALAITAGGGTLDQQVVVTSGGAASATYTAPGQAGTSRIRATYQDQAKEVGITITKDAPPDDGGGDPSDEFDLSTVTFLHTNVSKWKVVSKITNASARKPNVCFGYSPSNWPTFGRCNCIVGNPWIVKKVNGRWYAATWEWLRKGVMCKHPEGDWYTGILRQTKAGPLNSSSLSKGEEIGLMVSAWARTGPPSGSPRWRTNVKMIRWDQ